MTKTFSTQCTDVTHRLFALAGDRLDQGMAEVSPLLAFATVALDEFTPAEQAKAVAEMVEAGWCNNRALDDPGMFLASVLHAEGERLFGPGWADDVGGQ